MTDRLADLVVTLVADSGRCIRCRKTGRPTYRLAGTARCASCCTQAVAVGHSILFLPRTKNPRAASTTRGHKTEEKSSYVPV